MKKYFQMDLGDFSNMTIEDLKKPVKSTEELLK